jgi:hypothetical protein
MSRLRLAKVSTPSNPPSGSGELFFSSSLTPSAPAFIDESGNVVRIGGLTTKDYRVIRVVTLTGSGTYTPTTGAQAFYAEGVGAGGQGGGAASPSANQACVGGGGGAGAYSAVWIAVLAASYAYVCGVGGSTSSGGATGQDGGDTTLGAVLTAKGGKGGANLATGVTVTDVAGGLGGAAASGIGDHKAQGNAGGYGKRYSGTQATSGDGAPGFFGGGAPGRVVQGAGIAGLVYGAGGSGAIAYNAGGAANGAAGSAGVIRIWEFA